MLEMVHGLEGRKTRIIDIGGRRARYRRVGGTVTIGGFLVAGSDCRKSCSGGGGIRGIVVLEIVTMGADSGRETLLSEG